MTYVKVGENLYPASVMVKSPDRDWNDRESKSITLEGDYLTINALFPDGTAWSTVTEDNVPSLDENGNPVYDAEGNPVYDTVYSELDNSEFNIRGDLTVHNNGTCTVKMGKLTELEKALSGAVTTEELDAAYMEGVNEA